MSSSLGAGADAVGALAETTTLRYGKREGMVEQMALDVALRCCKQGCGRLFAANAEHGVPDLMVYCPDCAAQINRRIQTNLMADTGRLRGSVRIVGGKRVGGSDG